MIQRYSDVAEGNVTALAYRQGRKQYLTLKIWLGDVTATRPRKFFVMCPFCNSSRVQVAGLKKIQESFISDKKTDKTFINCIKCDKQFLVDDLVIGKEIYKKAPTMRRYQLFIKSYGRRPDFESEIISALTRTDASKKFKARYFSSDFSWDLDKVLNHVVDMTGFIENQGE